MECVMHIYTTTVFLISSFQYWYYMYNIKSS